MSEKNFWTLIRNNLGLKMWRVENRVMKGMPDIHYLKDGKSGWIELKYLSKWPKKRFSTGFKLNQAFWARNYCKEKGKSWILIRVERDFTALVEGKHADDLYNRPSRIDFFKMCSFYKRGNMTKEDWEEITETILL
jgi:hypothetical protein